MTLGDKEIPLWVKVNEENKIFPAVYLYLNFLFKKRSKSVVPFFCVICFSVPPVTQFFSQKHTSRGKLGITIFQPQVSSWNNNILKRNVEIKGVEQVGECLYQAVIPLESWKIYILSDGFLYVYLMYQNLHWRKMPILSNGDLSFKIQILNTVSKTGYFIISQCIMSGYITCQGTFHYF